MASRTSYRITGHKVWTVHQIVAYNFRRAREEAGWTQAQTSEMLEPLLGMRLNQAGVSAIEKTFDSHRRRNIDVHEVVAFSRCFGRPIGWFFIPPPGAGEDAIEPLAGDKFESDLRGADLTTLVVGAPDGWDSLMGRIKELTSTDATPMQTALRNAFGSDARSKVEQQLELRRQAVQTESLKRLVSHEDEIITGMAKLLVELVKTTPLGMDTLRDRNPDEALELLAEGDRLVQPKLEELKRRRSGRPNRTTRPIMDELEAIDVGEALTDQKRSE